MPSINENLEKILEAIENGGGGTGGTNGFIDYNDTSTTSWIWYRPLIAFS